MAWHGALRAEIEETFQSLVIPVVEEAEDFSDGQGRQRMFGYHVHRHLNTTKIPQTAEEKERRARKRRAEYEARASNPRRRGRPPGAGPKRDVAMLLLGQGLTIAQVCEQLGVSKSSVINWKKLAV